MILDPLLGRSAVGRTLRTDPGELIRTPLLRWGASCSRSLGFPTLMGIKATI